MDHAGVYMSQTIRLGSRGNAVAELQAALAAVGVTITADGSFGPATEAAVKAFQSANGLTPDGVVGSRTWAVLLGRTIPSPIDGLSFDLVTSRARSLGHQVWETPNRLWLFGIRGRNRTANSFDDVLGCCWTDERGSKLIKLWPGTTDPGSYWLLNPSNPSGTAILVQGQYLDTWMIDLHGGHYNALCQRNGKVRVYRDASRDNKHDLLPETIASGFFGINIHAATQVPGGVSELVDKWSAGCQVHATDNGFDEMMRLAHMQVVKTGLMTFSYTLLDEWR
jgi:peptidoglycan hydrolase-like protein with peptidoglycan-binding domain